MLTSVPARSFAPELPHSLVLDAAEGLLLLTQPRRYRPRLSVGCAWDVEPRNCEVIDEQDCLQLAGIHENLLRTLPVGAALQVLMTISPTQGIPAWEALRTEQQPHPVVQAQRASMQAGLPHRELTTQSRLRLIRTVLTVRIPMDGHDSTVGAWVRALLQSPMRSGAQLATRLAAQEAAALERLRSIGMSLESTMQAAGHQMTRLDSAALGHRVALGLRPTRAELPVIQPDVPVAEQVLDTEMRNVSGGWAYGATTRDDVFVEQERSQLLTLHEAPPKTYPGILCAPRAPLGCTPIALWSAWEGPLTIAVNVAVVDRAAEEGRLRRKRFFANLHSKKSVENALVVKQLDEVFVDMMLTGGGMLWGRVHVALWGSAQAVPQGLNRVLDQAKLASLQFAHDRGWLGSQLLLQILPLGFDPFWPSERWINRARRLPIKHIANLLPLYGGFRGTSTCAVPFLNQRGEVVNWFPFDSTTNAHSAWTGTSGAGKTHGVAYVVNHLLSLGATIVIIDPLTRYRHLNASWGGNLQTIGFEAPPCFNLFYGDSRVSFQSAFVKQLASGGGEKLGWEEFNVLSAALAYNSATWDTTRGEMRLTPFIEEVLQDGCFDKVDRRSKRLGMQIARKLKLFYGTGPQRGDYADFVDGFNTFRIEPGLNVIELGGLKGNEGLQGILFFATVHLMYQFFRDPQRFSTYKFAFFDEAWAHAKITETAEEVDRMTRTSRNDDVSVHFLSQLVRDWDTPMGAVIRALVGTTFFLKQEGDEIAKVKDLFDLSPVEVEMLPLAQKTEDFSSFYLRLSDKHGGQARIVSDPYTTMQMSQDRTVVQRRNQAIAAAGGDVRAALATLAAEELAHGS